MLVKSDIILSRRCMFETAKQRDQLDQPEMNTHHTVQKEIDSMISVSQKS